MSPDCKLQIATGNKTRRNNKRKGEKERGRGKERGRKRRQEDLAPSRIGGVALSGRASRFLAAPGFRARDKLALR